METDWNKVFAKVGALWVHSGDIHAQPFVRTSSGLISEGCFRGRKVQENPGVLSAAAAALITHPELESYLIKRIRTDTVLDRVVGPATSGIALASHIACLLGTKTAFADKEGNAGKFSFAGFSFEPYERVLLVDDTVTSGKTFLAIRDALSAMEPTLQILPILLTLCNRSNRTHIGDYQIMSLVTPNWRRWVEGENPFTRTGAEIMPPLSVKNCT